MNISQYRKRFYNLMESELGNVKPLINEGAEIVDGETKITQLSIKDGYNDSTVTLSNGETYTYGGPPETTYMAPNLNCKVGSYLDGKLPVGCVVLVTTDGKDYSCDSTGCVEEKQDWEKKSQSEVQKSNLK